jgi:hypothetical protein
LSDLVSSYVNQDLHLPRGFDDEFSDLLVSQKNESDKPFPRKVDLWWATVTIGAALKRHRAVTSNRVKFNTGAILGQESWRIAHMELLALGREGESALANPHRVVEIADEYSMAGAEWITENLRGSSRPAIKLLSALEQIAPETSQPSS